jgi:membrane associated rhomboid family serine protease
MPNERFPQRTRDLVFFIEGLMDCIFGALFLLSWFKLLPVDLAAILGIPAWLAGVLGAVLVLSGLVVVTYQRTKLKVPA